MPGLLRTPIELVFRGAGVSQGRVHAVAVVPAQPVQHRVFRFADRGEVLAVQPLHLQRAEQCLRAGVDAPMSRSRRSCSEILQDQGVQFSHDVALETAMDFFFRQTFFCPAINVEASARFASHTHHCNSP